MLDSRDLRQTGAAALIGILAVAACDRLASPSPLSELAAARARWAANGATNYAVESRIRCFCPGEFAVWTRLSIRDDRVSSVEPLEPLPPGAVASTSGWQTVQQLFDVIERRVEDDTVARLVVRYHPALGYPEQIAVTCRSNVIDCGVTYELRNLVR